MFECIGWMLGAVLMWWGVVALVKAIPESQRKRMAEDDAYWKSEGVR